MIDAVTVGETMAMVRTHSAGKPQNQTQCTLALGGAESNVAIGLARLGYSVRWISALGADAFGDIIESTLRQEGVAVVAPRSTDRPTGLMVKSPSKSTERFVSYYRAGSAAAALTPEMVGDELLSGARLLHLTGITPALSESARRLTLELAARASSLGLTVSLDINFRPALWSSQQAALILRELAAQADLVFGDRDELQLLVDDAASDDRELLELVADLGATECVMKQGEAGATTLLNGEIMHQSALSVAVVDTVGAGDAFVAGYLSGWLDSAGPKESLLRGVICGAQACTNAGDWEGSPSLAQLEAAKLELAS